MLRITMQDLWIACGFGFVGLVCMYYGFVCIVCHDALVLPSNRLLNMINKRYRLILGITLMLVAIGCIAAGVVFLVVADAKMS